MKREIKILEKKFLKNENDNRIEIGVDEAGRGPLFGRVYAAAVILPYHIPDNDFEYKDIRDSKKIHSEKKLQKIADYIKEHSIAWSVCYSTEEEIDKHNIRIATHMAMHKAIKNVIQKMLDININININKNMSNDNKLNDKINNKLYNYSDFYLVIDGNDFTPFTYINNTSSIEQVCHSCIESGDNKYSSIAAASILAKVERDAYIKELCTNNKLLNEYYNLEKNKGYGTKLHIEGIKKYGITKYHRRTFGLCKYQEIIDI